MSGICGYIGEADPGVLQAMLEAVPYRGDRTDTASGPGFGLGYRWWGDRPGKSPGIWKAPDGVRTACAGTLAPAVPSPAADLDARLREGRTGDLDGAFAAARWEPSSRTMTLIRDPFGVRSLYTAEHRGVLYFASELKQILAVADFPAEPDLPALHKYLTFSFVPGEVVPVRGVRRLLPGHVLRAGPGGTRTEPYFTLSEHIDPALSDVHAAVREIRRLGKRAVRKRLNGEPRVGLYLSGGLDSSAVAVWLQKSGTDVSAFTLDFGAASVEREQAAQVASALGIPLTSVPADGARIAALVPELIHRLDLPFGDAVTGPHLLLAQAARSAGLSAVFNGEGGDQLFGGWTSKPMVAAAAYAGLYDDHTPEEEYLHSYHRFYGEEPALYTEDFQARLGTPGQRRALLSPYLGEGSATKFLNRVRLADIALKGSQNILPRAERIANASALDVRVPLFDRALAELSFSIDPTLKLHGACEKYVLKLAMQDRLPEDIVWRRKFGMSVPVTDWALGERGSAKPGPLAPLLDDWLGDASVRSRGLLRPAYVASLRAGHAAAGETRRRRLGERLWALLMLEGWMRTFIDRRGRAMS